MKLLPLAPVCALLLAGCEPAPPSPKRPVWYLNGEFTISDTMKSSGSGRITASGNRGMLIKGSFGQLVTVETNTADDSLTFTPVDGKPMQVTATISEHGSYNSSDPESNSVVKIASSGAFKGDVDQPLELSVRKSLIGPGDEVSFRIGATLSGKESTQLTMQGGAVVDSEAGAGMMTGVLDSDPGGDPGKRRYAARYSLLPVPGPRPAGGIDQQIWDNIRTHPGLVHTGLQTGGQRSSWHYSGTVVKVNQTSPAESMNWSETIVFKMRLDKP